ncbi:hypothetical protein BH23CHL5_BH23CHL5_26640 [soil metagenome]
MTALTDFAPEDLAILNRTPTAVAMAAAYAEQNGAVTLMRELRAGLSAAREAAFAFPDNEVVQALAATMQDVDSDEPREPESLPVGGDTAAEDVVEERNPALAQETAIELAGQSMAIMQQTATLEEVVEFKHWLYAIANQVTLASKSGGFLGIGGTQVADAERQFLARLHEAMEIDVTAAEQE